MSMRRGRPVGKDGGKSTTIAVRLSESERLALKQACESSGKSQTDIIREGLKMQINLIKYRN